MWIASKAPKASVQFRALTPRNHLATVAYDPVQALWNTAELQPYVAILDIGLPGMDGYELVIHLRETTLTA